MLNGSSRPPPRAQVVHGTSSPSSPSQKKKIDGCGYFRPKVDDLVRGYTFRASLGQGVFGHVFQVTKDEKTYACKVSRSGDKYKTQCAQEIEIMKELQGRNVCPNVVDSFEEFGLMFLVIECCAQSLTNYLQRHPAGLRLAEIKQLAGAIGRCLAVLKEKEIMHCDIKPDNIMLLRENDLDTVRLIDFGIATHGESHHEYLQALGYRAPEVVFGSKPYTRAIDLWSTGVVLFEARTGRQLFHPASNAELCFQMLCLLGVPPEELAALRFYVPAQFRFFFQHRDALVRANVSEDEQFFPEETLLALASKKPSRFNEGRDLAAELFNSRLDEGYEADDAVLRIVRGLLAYTNRWDVDGVLRWAKGQ